MLGTIPPSVLTAYRRDLGDRAVTAPAAVNQPRAYLIAVKAGQVAVKDDHVVVVDERACQAGLAVERDIDSHPRVTQAGRDRLCQLLVVFDHKHAH